MDIVQQTLEYMEQENTRRYACRTLKIQVSVKSYQSGYIIDPLDVSMKCGWGETLDLAVKHCAERNNIEL